jgi:hypothetical protein
MPNSDTAFALESVERSLALAVEHAGTVRVFLTVAELHVVTGRPLSTLTRLCRLHKGAIGAVKVAGAWQIHWPTFERFLSTGKLKQEAE